MENIALTFLEDLNLAEGEKLFPSQLDEEISPGQGAWIAVNGNSGTLGRMTLVVHARGASSYDWGSDGPRRLVSSLVSPT